MEGIILKKYFFAAFLFLANISEGCNDKSSMSNIITSVLSHEGDKLMRNRKEFSKYGIRNFLLTEYNSKKLTNYTVRTLTKEQAFEISKYLFYKYRINEINSCNLKLVLFDTYFNTGYGNASKIVQKSINRYYKKKFIPIDGVMGSNTINILNSIGDDSLFFDSFFIERLAYYKGLNDWKKYGKGWTKRIETYSTLEKLAVITNSNTLSKKQPLTSITVDENIDTDIPTEEIVLQIKSPKENLVLLSEVAYLYYINLIVLHNLDVDIFIKKTSKQ